MRAEEVLNIVNESPRAKAIEKQIERMENKIKKQASKGHRNCIAEFYYYSKEYSYNLEEEIKEHFIKNGFTFKLVTDSVCGGVRQDPYWIICW